MNIDRISGAIQANPEEIFVYLRDSDVGTRLAAFDAFLRMAKGKNPGVIGILSDFIAVMKIEIIPNLADETDIIKREALVHLAGGIGSLSRNLDNPSSILPLLDIFIELFNHPYPGVKAALIKAVGEILRRNFSEIDDRISNKLLRSFGDFEPSVKAAALSAWGNIASTAPQSAVMAIGPAYRLLQDENAQVRAEAAGFFVVIAKTAVEECATALPLIDELRSNDPDSGVRERASAAIQAISAARTK